jgi:signal transduction histidine kinase
MSMDDTQANSGNREINPQAGTRSLTIRYLAAFGLLSGLALGNYVILRAQIETSRFASAVYTETELQKSRLQGIALLSQKLMANSSPKDRASVRSQIVVILDALEAAHKNLVHNNADQDGLPREVRAIYFDPPWRLDAELKKYLSEARALANAPEGELNWLNPHFLYIDQAAMFGKMTEALNRIAAIYLSQSQRTTAFLEWLAIWSAGSAIVVLVISGVWIFHPMVRRMEKDMDVLRQLNETVKRVATIGNMVADVAHESRNSLQQMQACVGLLEDRIDGDGESRGLLLDLQKAQDRLHHVFEDLRGYIAPVALDLRETDLRKPVEEAWAALAPARANRDAALRVHPAAADTHCLADALRLEQVFRNLLENSLWACRDPLVVDVEFVPAVFRGAPALGIVLRDNGPGFTAAQKEQAFEPFYTTKNQGCGLGLAIVKRIIEAHRGEIRLGNHSSRGAAFHITLPKGNS